MPEPTLVDFSTAITVMILFLGYTIFYKIMTIWRVLWIPFALMWVHVIGNTAQQYDYGPELAQNHLHNLGIASIFMIFCTLYALPFEAKKFTTPTAKQYAKARSLSRDVLLAWTMGTICCIIYEIMNVTIYRQANIADGYSGKMDWFDILAYIIGWGLIIYNHVKIRPIGLAKLKKRLSL